MYFLLNFIFYLIVFICRLYFRVDNKFIFKTNGGKLKKYVSKDNQQSVTSNLGDNKKNNSFILKIFFQKIPPDREIIKRFFIINFISISIIFLKTCFSYNFFSSNFLYINILDKNIDIISLFKNQIIYIRLLYFISYSYVIYDLVYVLCRKIFNKKKTKVINKETYNLPNITLYSKDSKNVKFNKSGLMQNILITGSIGSGKTSAAISSIVSELISSYVFGMIIDVKGNYIKTVRSIANKYNMKDKVVEISLSSKYKYNPLISDISNFEIAARLKQVLTILSDKNLSDSYWLDKAESYIRDFITLIKSYTDELNFAELHNLVINKEYLYKRLDDIKQNILNNKYSDNKLFNINSAMENIKNEYLKLDERTIGIIKSEITRITNIFVSDINIYHQFCTSNERIKFESDKIYIVSIDIGKNPQLAKIISTYIKLEFQSQILSRKNITKPIFFICDEYQEIANVQDANFFALSREYECINVVSMQSYTSLLHAVQSENAAKVIIQNLVNKICFRNDDIYTVSEIIKQVGKEVKKYETVNYSESSQNSKYSMILNNFRNYKSGLSKSLSFSDRKEYSLTEEYFTSYLKTFEALILISDGNEMNVINKCKLKRWDEYT